MTESMVKYELNTDEGEQLELSLVSDKKVSITESVSDAKTTKQQAIQRFLDNAPKEPIACITKYSPGKRKTEYFRLSYRLGKRVKHIHIQGGSTIAQLAQYRAKKLQEMIDRGAELGELIAAVQTYCSSRYSNRQES